MMMGMCPTASSGEGRGFGCASHVLAFLFLCFHSWEVPGDGNPVSQHQALPPPQSHGGGCTSLVLPTYRLTQEDVERLSDAALTLIVRWFIPQGWESSTNENEQLLSFSFDELCVGLRY